MNMFDKTLFYSGRIKISPIYIKIYKHQGFVEKKIKFVSSFSDIPITNSVDYAKLRIDDWHFQQNRLIIESSQ